MWPVSISTLVLMPTRSGGSPSLHTTLVRTGMRVVQTIGVPVEPLGDDVDAVVVALKSRTIPATDAVAQSLAALAWLKSEGAKQFYFKYCSTFDSTPKGNIGPVTRCCCRTAEPTSPLFRGAGGLTCREEPTFLAALSLQLC